MAGALLFWAGMAVAHRRGAPGVAPFSASPSTGAVPLEAAGSAVFPLLTEVVFDTGEGPPQRSAVEGIGTVLYGRYVLTVAHATTLDHLEAQVRTPRGTMTLPVDGRRLSETTWLVDGDRRSLLIPLGRDETVDVALFALPAQADLPSFPCPIAGDRPPVLGEPIALLGSDPQAGVMVRPASVTALRGPGLVGSVANVERVFLVSLALASGESGAPIIALRDGSCALIGLAQGTYLGPRQLAWAVRIDPALQALALPAPAASEAPAGVVEFLRLSGYRPR